MRLKVTTPYRDTGQVRCTHLVWTRFKDVSVVGTTTLKVFEKILRAGTAVNR